MLTVSFSRNFIQYALLNKLVDDDFLTKEERSVHKNHYFIIQLFSAATLW